MSDVVLIPMGFGVLKLPREQFEAAFTPVAAAPSPEGASEPLLDAEQLAALCNVPVSWIEQAAREERIPSLQFGRWRRFKRSEVEAAVRGLRQ